MFPDLNWSDFRSPLRWEKLQIKTKEMFTPILWTTWKISRDSKWSSNPWLGNIATDVNRLVYPKELKTTVVFTMFIITDKIQVRSITNKKIPGVVIS